MIVVILLSRLHLSPYEPEHDDGRFFVRLRRGFDHARERPPALAALSVLAMSSLFAAAYLALLPVMANDIFDKGPTGFAALAAVTGFGSMIGALTTAFRENDPNAPVRGAARDVLRVRASPSSDSLRRWTAAFVAVVVVGGFYFSAMTTLNTLVQYLADENMRGQDLQPLRHRLGGARPDRRLVAGRVRRDVRRAHDDGARRLRDGRVCTAGRRVPRGPA